MRYEKKRTRGNRENSIVERRIGRHRDTHIEKEGERDIKRARY